MNKLYIITGPAGVGKSTISKLLAEKLSKSILIEGDDIYHMVIGGYVQAWRPNNHLDLFWKNIISLIENGLESGYDVIFNYIIHKKDYELLRDKFKKYDIIFKVLLVNEEELLRRDNLRKPDCRMKERCLVLLNSLKKEYLNSKNVLDATNLNEKETLKKIMEE